MYIGYLVCLLVVLQVAVGIVKYYGARTCNGRLKWHGKIGVWIWFTGMINIIIGAIFWHGQLVALRVILAVVVICVIIVVAIAGFR